MIISGTKLAEKRKNSLRERALSISDQKGRAPQLAVILVGEDPASQVYVGHKQKACEQVGIESQLVRLPHDISEDRLISEIQRLNEDPHVDGLLVQLPLPAELSAFDPTEVIAAHKDVDGLTSENMGKMIKNKAWAESCTPKGIMLLLKDEGVDLTGKNAVVVGRSQIVGWPMAWMLTRAHATVTVCHSRTKDLRTKLKEADIAVVAAGKPQFLSVEDFKKNSIVIDVGIHRVDGKLKGDVKTDGFEEMGIAYTPVPGGVGPMTVSVLLENVIALAERGEA